MHPPPPVLTRLGGWANFSIMMECTPENGKCHSVCTLRLGPYSALNLTVGGVGCVGALCVVWVMQGGGGGVGDFSAAHAIAKILWNFVSASKILFVTRAEGERE